MVNCFFALPWSAVPIQLIGIRRETPENPNEVIIWTVFDASRDGNLKVSMASSWKWRFAFEVSHRIASGSIGIKGTQKETKLYCINIYKASSKNISYQGICIFSLSLIARSRTKFTRQNHTKGSLPRKTHHSAEPARIIRKKFYLFIFCAWCVVYDGGNGGVLPKGLVLGDFLRAMSISSTTTWGESSW